MPDAGRDRARAPCVIGFACRRGPRRTSAPQRTFDNVYFLYVDESDTTTDEPAPSRWYCVTGVRVVARSYGPITDKLQRLVRRWHPPLPDTFELKGIDLFQGQGPWAKRDPAQRVEFAKAAATIIGEASVRVYVAMKPSEDFTGDYRTLLDRVIRRAASDVAKEGGRTGKQLLLIFDQRPDLDVSASQMMRQIRNDVVNQLTTSCRFIDHGYEANSRYAPLVQVADFAAYFLRKQKVMVREATLLAEAENELVVTAVDEIVGLMQKRMKRVPV